MPKTVVCTTSGTIFANQRKEESLATPFLAKHTYLLDLHLELNSGSSLHLYRSASLFYTRCAPFRAWKCSQARPAALHYCGSPLSAVSSTCKEIMWDKCYGSARLALFTASLTKKCVVWNCALSKWQCLHNETSVTRSILNSSKKQLLHLKSRRTRPRRHPISAQFLMGTSWRACAGCRSVESHLFMEGGLVCEWQVATSSCCAHQAPNMFELIELCRISKTRWGCAQQTVDVLDRWSLVSWPWFCRACPRLASRVLTNLAHIYWKIWKDWIHIHLLNEAHSWYQKYCIHSLISHSYCKPFLRIQTVAARSPGP